jgi:hypothetical protein
MIWPIANGIRRYEEFMNYAFPLFIAVLAISCSSPTPKPRSTRTDQALTSVCPSCGNPVAQDALHCPNCGADFSQQAPPQTATTRHPYSKADLRNPGKPLIPVSPQELNVAKSRLSVVRSDMPVKNVLDTLGLSRFRGHATKGEGPTTLALNLNLARDNIMDLYYQRRPGSSGWELSWVALDEAHWYPAQKTRSDAAFSRTDVREYGQPISPPVTSDELASAKERLTLLKPDMNVSQILASLQLSRCRGHFIVGSGSISLSVHGDLGDGHRLDMIYDRIIPPYSPAGWKLSAVMVDADGQGGGALWRAKDEKKQ